jgi:hypothetical protein
MGKIPASGFYFRDIKKGFASLRILTTIQNTITR